jgi:hypothetical protein
MQFSCHGDLLERPSTILRLMWLGNAAFSVATISCRKIKLLYAIQEPSQISSSCSVRKRTRRFSMLRWRVVAAVTNRLASRSSTLKPSHPFSCDGWSLGGVEAVFFEPTKSVAPSLRAADRPRIGHRPVGCWPPYSCLVIRLKTPPAALRPSSPYHCLVTAEAIFCCIFNSLAGLNLKLEFRIFPLWKNRNSRYICGKPALTY